MTSIPASRRARATTLAPRSCPSSPGLATTTRIRPLIDPRVAGLLHAKVALKTYCGEMNPAGELGLAARQVVARGTQVAGLAAASARTVLGTLSRGIRTVARPAGVRGVALEVGVLAMH